MPLLFKFSLVFALFSCFTFCTTPKKNVVATVKVLNPSQINIAVDALENRMARFGIEASVRQLNKEEIEINLSTKGNTNTLRSNLLLGAKLEFYETIQADYLLKSLLSRYKKIEGDTLDILQRITPFSISNTPILGYVKTQDTLQVKQVLQEVHLFDAHELEAGRLKILFGQKEESKHPVYIAKKTNTGTAALYGDIIENATQEYDYAGSASIAIEMKEDAAIDWENFTRRASQEKFQIAIVLDGLVYSATAVMSAIPGGRSSISGDFTDEEARGIATRLKLGYLPKMELLSFDVIEE